MTDKGYQSKEKVYIELHNFYSFPGNGYNIVAENISSPQYPSYHSLGTRLTDFQTFTSPKKEKENGFKPSIFSL